MPAATRSRDAAITHEVAINRIVFKWVIRAERTDKELVDLEAAAQKEIQATLGAGGVAFRESGFWLLQKMGKLEAKLAGAMGEPKELVMNEISLMCDEAAMAAYADKLFSGTDGNPLFVEHHDALARLDLFVKVAEVKMRFSKLVRDGDVEGDEGSNLAIVVQKLTEGEGKGAAAAPRDAADRVLRMMELLQW